LTCETRKKKFPYPDILGSFGIIGPNQLLISYKLMGIFQKFRMAPHITVPAVIKFRDTFIDDNYLALYFYHHGCDHVAWDKTVFGFMNLVDEIISSTFQFDNFDDYYKFKSGLPPKSSYRAVTVSFHDVYDIFYSGIGLNIYVNKNVKNEILTNKIKGYIFSRISFETNIIK